VKFQKSWAVAAGVGLVAMAMFTSAPAQADPVGAPTFRALAGVGSDTTERVMNALSEVIVDGSSNKIIASYDATGTTPIQTQSPAACSIARPNGSGAGRTALLASLNAADGCLQFSRSSSLNITASTPSLTYIPFGVDGMSFAVRSDSLVPRGLTLAEVRQAYTCALMPFVVPVLPQAGSGSRAFWLSQMGPITEAQIAAGTYPCLVPTGTTVNGVAGTGRTYVQENDARSLKTDELMPFSVGLFNVQSAGVVTDVRGLAVLGTIDGKTPQAVYTGFGIKRDLYNVIPTANIATAPWSTTFVGASSAVCTNSAIIAAQGFTPASNCGDTTQRS
jgi:hypothetical protein